MGQKKNKVNPNVGMNGGRVANHGKPTPLHKIVDEGDRWVLGPNTIMHPKGQKKNPVTLGKPQLHYAVLFQQRTRFAGELHDMARAIGKVEWTTKNKDDCAALLSAHFKKNTSDIETALKSVNA